MLPPHQGLIEMKHASDAEKVVAAANMDTITVAGIHPKIEVSTEHAHLNKRYWIVIYALIFYVLKCIFKIAVLIGCHLYSVL